MIIEIFKYIFVLVLIVPLACVFTTFLIVTTKAVFQKNIEDFKMGTGTLFVLCCIVVWCYLVTEEGNQRRHNKLLRETQINHIIGEHYES